MTTPEYPLFCVDRGLDYDMRQYLGPFETLKDAAGAASEAWIEACEPRDVTPCEFEVRRCRRVDGRDLGVVRLLASLHELADEEICSDPPKGAWGDWEEEIVQLPNVEAAREALEAFLTAHFRCRAYILEPRPEPTEAAS
jgi:hypothetical protein